jgi:hypothetical protein
MKKNLMAYMLTFSLGCTSSLALAFDESVLGQTGDQIMEKVDAHELGFGDIVANVTLDLEQKSGSIRYREMAVEIKEGEQGDVSDDYVTEYRRFAFLSPADVKGTSVLVHAKSLELDDMWIYLPAFKRVKRISGSNRGAKFVGSEYYYEDLSPQKASRYRDEMLGKSDDSQYVKVKRTPLFKGSSYAYNVTFVNPDDDRVYRIDYYDSSDNIFKSQMFYDYKLFLNRYLISTRQIMSNQKNGNTTTMHWDNVVLQTSLNANRFDKSFLKTGR